MCIMLNRKYLHSALCFVTFLFRFVVSGNEILTVKSNAVTYVESRDVVLSGSRTRWRRSMNQQEIDEATSMHNTLRRREGASDMEYMKWNRYLASMAQDWADGCNFVHGQPHRNHSTLPYATLGQNLFATTGQLNVTRSIKESWYDEKQYYDYDNLYCKPGEQCGHYTQVAWASSREIGCAISRCSNLRSTNLGKSNYLVCNYGPAGNYKGQKPYKKGNACSRCRSEVNWCNEGLCSSDCRKSGPGCGPCSSNNGGCEHFCTAINSTSALCSCKIGFFLDDNGTSCITSDKQDIGLFGIVALICVSVIVVALIATVGFIYAKKQSTTALNQPTTYEPTRGFPDASAYDEEHYESIDLNATSTDGYCELLPSTDSHVRQLKPLTTTNENESVPDYLYMTSV